MADFVEHFRCKNGEQVTIEIDDVDEIAVFDSEHRAVGRIEFSQRDGSLKIVWMYLDFLGKRFTRQGIGRRCIQIMSERFGLSIWAEDDDGLQQDDGSHLTGDAPAFVARMRSEGLILPDSFEQEWLEERSLEEGAM